MASYEHNLLPFSTPQSHALLSAESKATEAANNKERLDECRNNVWCHTIFRGAKKTPHHRGDPAETAVEKNIIPDTEILRTG